MNDFVVNDELAATVVDDESTNATTTISEGVVDLGVETALVDDGETLLDVAGLSHADELAVSSHIEDAVLFEDWAEH